MATSQTQRPHKPLFNRRYLLLLVWILPLLILLLQRSGQEAPADIRVSADGRLYGQLSESPRAQLHLLLPQGPMLTDADWIEGQVRQQWLAERLDSAPVQTWLARHDWQLTAPPEANSGYLRVRFNLPVTASAEALPGAIQRAALEQLLLAQPPDAVDSLTKTQARLTAQRYLDRQAPELQLLSALGEQLQRGSPAATVPPRWTLLATDALLSAAGLNHDNPRDAPAPDVEPGVAAENRRPTAPPLTGSAQLPANRHADGWALLAERQPAPHTGAELARQRLSATLIAELLPQLLAAEGRDYRWRWNSLPQQGYRALLLRQAPAALLEAPGATLAARLTQAQLDQTRDRLQTQLDQLLSDDPASWLELLALYQLPVDSERAFRATLQGIDLPTAHALLTAALPPAQSLHLSFTSTGKPSS